MKANTHEIKEGGSLACRYLFWLAFPSRISETGKSFPWNIFALEMKVACGMQPIGEDCMPN